MTQEPYAVNIPPSLGMDEEYWEAESRKWVTGGHVTLPSNINSHLWPDEDQMHHFAGYFLLGTYATGSLVLWRALESTGDYPKTNNPGDYNLGIVGFDLGRTFAAHPGYVGNLVRRQLEESADQALTESGWPVLW